MSQSHTQGVHHLGLTVPDVQKTAAFFVKQLNFFEISRNNDYPSIFISDSTTMLTLWQAENPQTCQHFDRHNNIGLHHFALRVADKAILASLHEQLSGLDDVDIEFSPETLAGTDIQHMMCTIPGGLRVELIAA